MGFWTWLTGGGKTVETAANIAEKVTGGLIAGIDAVWYTDEEKAAAKQKAAETLLEFWKTTANENTERSKARRELAKMVFRVYFSLILIGVGTYLVRPEFSAFVFDVVGKITWLVGLVGGIYFGPHQISKIWTKNGNKGGE